jgi:hypothetical protein
LWISTAIGLGGTSAFSDSKSISKYTTLIRTLGITSSSLTRLSGWRAFLASAWMRGWLHYLIRRCIRRLGTHSPLYLALAYHSEMRDICLVTAHKVEFGMGCKEYLWHQSSTTNAHCQLPTRERINMKSKSKYGNKYMGYRVT